jgi:hypothetical protein
VQRWKSEQFPAIRAQAKKDGATIYFADEAGLRSDYHAGTAPDGSRPHRFRWSRTVEGCRRICRDCTFTACPDRQRAQVARPGEADGCRDVTDGRTSRDQRRTSIDHRVPDSSRGVERLVAREDDLAVEATPERRRVDSRWQSIAAPGVRACVSSHRARFSSRVIDPASCDQRRSVRL